MMIEQYWNIFLKRWWIILACMLLVGSGAYIGSKLMTPSYKSYTLVQITLRTNTSQTDINSLLASDQLVQTMTLLATGDPVLHEVASHYPHMSADKLAGMVSASVKTNTQLFEIDVQGPNPQQNAQIANDVASTLIQQQQQATQQSNQQAQAQFQQEIDTTLGNINTLSQQIADAQKGAQITALQSQLNGLQQHYNEMQTTLAQLKLTQALNSNILTIAQPAQPSSKPVQPNTFLNTAAGLLSGLFLGFLLALLLAQFDTRLRLQDLTQMVDWPVLGTIWNSHASNYRNLIYPNGPAINSEAYRILRTNIGLLRVDNPIRSLLVSSSTASEGKSVTSINLAIFMAKSGHSTLLIDADLRNPLLDEAFDLPEDVRGLSNAVLTMGTPVTTNSGKLLQAIPPPLEDIEEQGYSPVTESMLKPFIHPVPDVPNLWIMPTGPLPPNPPELLDSRAMQKLLAAIHECDFEMIIFDTPPLLGLSDSSILAAKIKDLLLVIDIKKARRTQIERVKTLTQQAGITVLGYVINKQTQKYADLPYGYRYGHKKQKYHQSLPEIQAAAVSMDRGSRDAR
ncbi:polysaccharide biosynthesis tyrosine autokinase [Dictyobacter kobayashii]|uniref:CobQ/CobB/MinD/ParA nucleotide binding domain-containing protein n=1 Tax=Dictyobacter kobayashii TaxID=2014872 RepID=A0A402APD8_9CHLR|nr:polysaccharide biosynthesis tyrosine autokinase [Dictyobacter kobayashii]GCE20962.1 hypothetical protein KDK_47620 [Dictyobacter kobayashii]